jgi:hypothetical protein
LGYGQRKPLIVGNQNGSDCPAAERLTRGQNSSVAGPWCGGRASCLGDLHHSYQRSVSPGREVTNQPLKWARVRSRQDSTIIHKVRAFLNRLIVPLRTRATPRQPGSASDLPMTVRSNPIRKCLCLQQLGHGTCGSPPERATNGGCHLPQLETKGVATK